MKKLFAVIIVLLSFVFAAPAQAQDVTSTPKLGSTVVQRIFAKRYVKTLAILAKEFPAENTELLRRIALIDRAAGTQAEKLSAAFAALSQVRRKYADQVIFAPDATLIQVVGLLGEFHLAVLKNEGPAVCGLFATGGAGALFGFGLSELYAERLDAQSEAYFAAVVQAIENPTFHDKVKTEDWTNVSRVLVAAGGSVDDIKIIAANDPKNANLCVSVARFLLFLAQVKNAESERLRADFVHNAVGY